MDVEVEVVAFADLPQRLQDGLDALRFENRLVAQDGEVVDVHEMAHGVHLDAGAQRFDDAPACFDFGVVLAHDRVFPDAERAQFIRRADPDGDVAPVPGNEAVGQAERRLLEQDVARAQTRADVFKDLRLVVELALAALDQADGVTENHARQEHPLILEREDGIEPRRREEAGHVADKADRPDRAHGVARGALFDQLDEIAVVVVGGGDFAVAVVFEPLDAAAHAEAVVR